MSLYAVGDLQGCLDPLKALLDHVNFDPTVDQLWLAGDLVNRGPQSLDCLRFVRSLKDSAKVVLGNHDLHLLALYYGIRQSKKSDTCADILNAADADKIIAWLRQQPLMQFNATRQLIMTHAGIPHIWSFEKAQKLANEVSQTLADETSCIEFLQHMYGNEPDTWHHSLTGFARLRTITNYFTRMRFITIDGKLDFAAKEGTENAPKDFAAWFAFYPQPLEQRMLFGHWAALMGKTNHQHIIGLDTGYVWGNHLTLLDVDSQRRWTCQADSLAIQTTQP